MSRIRIFKCIAAKASAIAGSVIVGIALVPLATAKEADPAVVVSSVTLNPAAANSVTIVTPAGAAPARVNVGNTVSVNDVNRPLAEPFRMSCIINEFKAFDECDFGFTVPAGKTLVISYASYLLQYPDPDSQLLFAYLTNTFQTQAFLPIAAPLNGVRT